MRPEGAAREQEVAPSASVLVENLRDIDYSLQTAAADVIDRSLVAGTWKMEMSLNGRKLRPFGLFHSQHPATQHHSQKTFVLDGHPSSSEYQLAVTYMRQTMAEANPAVAEDWSHRVRIINGLHPLHFEGQWKSLKDDHDVTGSGPVFDVMAPFRYWFFKYFGIEENAKTKLVKDQYSIPFDRQNTKGDFCATGKA